MLPFIIQQGTYNCLSHQKTETKEKVKPDPSNCGGNIVHDENVPAHKKTSSYTQKKKEKKKQKFSYVLHRPQLALLVETFLHIEENRVVTLFKSI